MNTKTKANKLKSALMIIFTAIMLSITLTCFSGCKVGNLEIESTVFTRDATVNDINIDNSNDFALSMNYTMIPKVDINNLELTFKYKDSSGKTLTTKTKLMGNVKAGIQYKISISLSEFGFFDLFKISYASITVSRGTVSTI